MIEVFTTSDAFRAHIDDAVSRSDAGDEFAARALSAMALLVSGWRYGDPDPSDGPDGPIDPDDGGEPIEDFDECKLIVLDQYRLKRAA